MTLQHKLPQHVFVYGTLKEGYGNHRILANATKIGPAITTNDGYIMADGGFPWSIPDGKFHVKGELYLVNDEETMNYLDRLEGVPSLFDHHYTTVRTEDGEVHETMMYVAANRHWESLKQRKQFVKPNDNNILEWGE